MNEIYFNAIVNISYSNYLALVQPFKVCVYIYNIIYVCIIVFVCESRTWCRK